jgi:glycine hydroxymethyltransferase
MIICGGTAYPRIWDFPGFSQIAESIGAVLVADIAHIAGLVVGGAHPHPLPHAEIVTTTSHKTLRGPRGAMILSQGKYAKELDRAVFPGLQGGPHNQTTAAIAVALHEAATDEFTQYAHQVVANAKALAEALKAKGFGLISGGTDNHMILMDVTTRGINGKPAARALNHAGIACNYNTIPFDPRKPMDPSGLRLGTPSVTSRGMQENDMIAVADWIYRALDGAEDPDRIASIRTEVREFCAQFPAPGLRVA